MQAYISASPTENSIENQSYDRSKSVRQTTAHCHPGQPGDEIYSTMTTRGKDLVITRHKPNKATPRLAPTSRRAVYRCNPPLQKRHLREAGPLEPRRGSVYYVQPIEPPE